MEKVNEAYKKSSLEVLKDRECSGSDVDQELRFWPVHNDGQDGTVAEVLLLLTNVLGHPEYI